MSAYTGVSDDKLWKQLKVCLSIVPLEHNRETAMRYCEERRANGMKPATVAIDANALRSLGAFIGDKKFEDLTKPDMIRYFNQATGTRRWANFHKDGSKTETEKPTRLSFSTLDKRKEVLKPFFRWLLGLDEGEIAPMMKGIKSRKASAENVPADQLVTKEDLRLLILNTRDAQGKALIATLYESGLRAMEFASLNIHSVVFDQYGAVLTLPKDAPGLKTGSRRIRLFDCVSYLHDWYEQHPMKDDPKAPLFFSNSNRAPRRRLSGNALYTAVMRAGLRASLKKHLHPHLFRHSAATERARLGWNEGQMRAFFGWAKNSEMPSWYVHLAGQDYENVELERRGLTAAGVSGPALKPLICKLCRAENVMTATFCKSCRNPVSPAAEAKVEEDKKLAVREEIARLIAGMSKDEIARIMREASS